MKNFIRTFLISISTSLCLIAQLHFAIAQTASILPQAETQFLDNNGKPVTSGTVDFYIPGSTTRKTTWQDADKAIANTNPVKLDGSGRALIYGYGGYRQVLKDRNGNLIWDRVTNSYSIPNGQVTNGDGNSVGTILQWGALVAPTQYVFSYGQEISRVTYPDFFAAITLTQSVNCSSGSNVVSGISDTSQVPIGASIEASCFSGSVTVSSKTSNSYTVSANAIATTTVNAVVFPFGNGNGSTTFNVPDLRGRVLAGRDNMGGVAASRLTSTYFANASAIGAAGGAQSETLTLAQVPTGIISNLTVTDTRTWGTNTAACSGTCTDTTNVGEASTGVTARVAPVTVQSGALTSSITDHAGGGAHTIVQPTITINYIIKITADQTGLVAAGVQSIQSMAGSIFCNTSLTCAPILGVNTIGCTTSTLSQLGCITPDGVTTTVNGSGQLSAISSVASSIKVGTTGITSGVNGKVLYDNAGILGELGTTGTGNVVLATNSTLVSPTLSGSGIISFVNIAQLGASSLFGNATGSPATMAAITLDPTLNFSGTTLRCTTFGSSQTGCVPGSGGGSTSFLRADGTWAVPGGGGNVVGPGSATSNAVAVFNGASGTIIKNSNLIYTTGNLSFAQTAATTNTTALVDNSAIAGGYNAILELKNSAHDWWIMGAGAASGLSSSGELAFFDATNSRVRASIGPTGGFDLWNAAGAATGDFGAGAIAAQEGYFQGSRPWCDVLANGAKGDGVTDDTAAIQGCVTKLSVLTTGTIFFPPPHGGAYCTFTGITVAASNSLIFLGTGINGSQISTCGHNVAALSIAGSNSRIVNMQILGAGYGATSTLPVSFPAVDLTGCVQCDIENSEIHGGTNGILCGNGCGDITVYNTRISYAYSSVVNIQCSSGLCGGYFKRVKMDQDPPTGNPGPVAGSTISAWSAGATVNNGDVRIVSGTWNIQYTVGGTTGGSPPTVKPYFQNITDGTATAQLFGPATYYGLKCDTGCNQSFVEQGDILCACYTYSVAMLNSLAGTAPTLLNIQTTNMSGYIAAINLSAGTEFVSSSNVIGSCFTTGCVGVLVASGFGPATTTLMAGIRFTDNLFFGHTYGLDLATNRTLGALFRGNEFYGMVTSALIAGNVKQFNFSDNVCGGQGQYGAANGQCYTVPVGADYYVINNNLTFGSTNPSSPANGAGSAHSTVSGNL